VADTDAEVWVLRTRPTGRRNDAMNETRPTDTPWRWGGKPTLLGLAVLVGVASFVGMATSQRPPPPSRAAVAPPEPTPVERGHYLVQIAGCNDCHTSGYAQAGGSIPEPHWLTGDTLGYRGPWGTTYASNLRLYMQNFSEAQWVQLAQNLRTRPPMPWVGLQHMTPADLRALYHFVRSLGPAAATVCAVSGAAPMNRRTWRARPRQTHQPVTRCQGETL
jgi:mono/diheme cytochrome c family protein